MTRKEARKTTFGLLFESGFRTEETPLDIYNVSAENRDIEDDEYISEVFFGVLAKIDDIDKMIGDHSHGWKTERISRVSRTVLRIAVYELMYMKDIPSPVSINEALELCREFDDEKARPFVNGVLNAVKNCVGDKKE